MVLVWIINQTFFRIYENLTTVILCLQKPSENPPWWSGIRNVLLSNRQTESRRKWKQGLIVGDVPSILERGCKYNQADSAVLCLGFLLEISLFAYTVWCFSSHISATAWVLGKTTATEYILGTEKDKVFPIVFSAFYLPLALSTVKNTQTHLAKPDKLPLTSKMKLFVSFCYVASSSNGELEAFFLWIVGSDTTFHLPWAVAASCTDFWAPAAR